jgi:hypothetical protein
MGNFSAVLCYIIVAILPGTAENGVPFHSSNSSQEADCHHTQAFAETKVAVVQTNHLVKSSQLVGLREACGLIM